MYSSLHSHPLPARRKQYGMATLLIAMVLLVAATLAVLFTNRTAVTEQRISANEARTRQAMAAAQAAADEAIARINTGGNLNAGQRLAATGLGLLEGGSAAAASYWICGVDPANPTVFSAAVINGPPTSPTDNTPVCSQAAGLDPWVVAWGWSDDLSARQVVVMQISGTNPLGGGPNYPFTARGSTGASGSFTVVNYFADTAYWMGDSLDYKNATAKSFVRNRLSGKSGDSPKDFLGCNLVTVGDDTFYDKCNTNPSTSDYLVESAGSGQDSFDVIDNDTNLANLSDQALFESFLGAPPDVYLKNTVERQTTNEVDLDGKMGEVIWLGSPTLNPTGSTYTLAGMTLGSRERPVVLVINGNATFGAQFEMYGMLYIAGNVSGAGGPILFGSLIVGGNADSMTGNMMVVYDAQVMDNVRKIGEAGIVSGTWRDWWY